MTMYFVASSLEKEVTVNVLGKPVDVNLSWANGMIGILPVFDTQENAEKYATNNKCIAISVDD